MNSVVTFMLKSPAHKFEEAGLHDATLQSITLDWAAAEVVAVVFLFGGIRATLEFQSITSVVLPRHLPWGPSTSINAARERLNGEYELEMQSGDTLCFSASSWSLKIAALPADA